MASDIWLEVISGCQMGVQLELLARGFVLLHVVSLFSFLSFLTSWWLSSKENYERKKVEAVSVLQVWAQKYKNITPTVIF